jgi:hypothetical protein
VLRRRAIYHRIYVAVISLFVLANLITLMMATSEQVIDHPIGSAVFFAVIIVMLELK